MPAVGTDPIRRSVAIDGSLDLEAASGWAFRSACTAALYKMKRSRATVGDPRFLHLELSDVGAGWTVSHSTCAMRRDHAADDHNEGRNEFTNDTRQEIAISEDATEKTHAAHSDRNALYPKKDETGIRGN